VSGHLTFRPIQPDDDAFLRAVYASTRAEELALVNWSDAEKDAFLRMQFDAQHRHYQQHYPAADFFVILRDAQPVGRLYLARLPEEFRIIDIALLPQCRRTGIGTTLLKNILSEASTAGRRVRLHVERSNPALRLYQRLGFKVIEEGSIHLLMERPT
jgi:ribosomal protein S18 acetylase RimI-like enzyme